MFLVSRRAFSDVSLIRFISPFLVELLQVSGKALSKFKLSGCVLSILASEGHRSAWHVRVLD